MTRPRTCPESDRRLPNLYATVVTGAVLSDHRNNNNNHRNSNLLRSKWVTVLFSSGGRDVSGQV